MKWRSKWTHKSFISFVWPRCSSSMNEALIEEKYGITYSVTFYRVFSPFWMYTNAYLKMEGTIQILSLSREMSKVYRCNCWIILRIENLWFKAEQKHKTIDPSMTNKNNQQLPSNKTPWIKCSINSQDGTMMEVCFDFPRSFCPFKGLCARYQRWPVSRWDHW